MNAAALGSAALPPLVRAIFAAAIFAWVVVALGRRALALSRVPLEPTPWEKALLCGAVGTGLLQYLPYGLAAVSCFRPKYLQAGVLVLVLLLAVDLLAVARRAGREIAAVRPRWSPEALLWGLFASALLLVLLVRSSTIGDLSDDDGYHLASPKRWLSLGTLAYLPSYTNTNAAMGFEMLYAIGLSVWDAVAAKAFNYASGVFTLLGVFSCAKRLSDWSAGIVAISLLMITSPLVNVSYVFSLAYVDLGACWMSISCVLCWLIWRERQDTRLLLFMALLAGFAASFKTTALMSGVAWAPVVLCDRKRQVGTWLRALPAVVGFGAVSALPTLPWFWRNFRNTGNPLYPMLSDRIATRDWDPAQAAILSKYVHYYTWGIGSGAGLSELKRKAILFGALVMIAVGGGLAAWLVRRPELRGILIFSTLYTVISVLLTGLITRYWLPAAMGACLVVGVLVSKSALEERWRTRVASAVMAVALLLQLRGSPNGHALGRDFRMAFGVSSMDEEYRDRPAWRVWNYLNAHTPLDAHVLMAAFYSTYGASSSGGFWVDRTCYATDSHLQGYIHLNDWQEFLRSIGKASIDYVAFSSDHSSAKRLGFSFTAAENEYEFCRRLVEEYGEKVFEADTLGVYRLKLPLEYAVAR
jgi:hypothetical protein